MQPTHSQTLSGNIWLQRLATAWFAVAVVGQLAFVVFITAFYGYRTVRGDFAAWNDKPIINGYIPDDNLGNVMFIAHVLLAAVVNIGGLLQLVPAIRDNVAGFHRWNGRLFLSIAFFLSIGGLWLTWSRETYLAVVGGISVSLNGVLILVFGLLAWRYARAKKFAAHRRWALRAFVVVSGVWFLRLGIMAWVLINQGPKGMNETMSGPADIALNFGSYLIPLGILELYLLAQRSDRPVLTHLALLMLTFGLAVSSVGVFGASLFMWWPYL